MKALILSELAEHYAIRERDTGSYETLKKSGMTFWISAYEIQGLGSMSVIEMEGMLGLMKMESFILTAEQKDLPLFSGDSIRAMGKRTLLMEFYDTMINPLEKADIDRYQQVKARYADLAPYETGPHWYDEIRYDFTLGASDKKLKDLEDKITSDYLSAYLKNAQTAPDADPAAKKAKTKTYVDGLFANGGPAVNQFIKLFGEPTAREIFEQYVFSCR